jgi:hypothetical protein
MEELGLDYKNTPINREDLLSSMIFLKYVSIGVFLVLFFIWCKRFEIGGVKRMKGKEVSMV